jgi:hypothetical protein
MAFGERVRARFGAATGPGAFLACSGKLPISVTSGVEIKRRTGDPGSPPALALTALPGAAGPGSL